jgi:AraC-like DNA-binding protein
LELGASDYLVKPCSVEELTRAIATQLKKRTVIQQWYATQSQPDIRSDSDQLSTNHTKSVAPQSFFPAHSQLDEAFYFIEANYHKPITLSDVAQAVGYSAAYLTSLTRKQTGQTIQRWIIERRMAAARTLLLNTDQNVEEIANQVGYLHVVHFFRQFRQFHGTTPQNWRSANRAKVRASDQEVFI